MPRFRSGGGARAQGVLAGCRSSAERRCSWTAVHLRTCAGAPLGHCAHALLSRASAVGDMKRTVRVPIEGATACAVSGRVRADGSLSQGQTSSWAVLCGGAAM
jgi:hypothetical protein